MVLGRFGEGLRPDILDSRDGQEGRAGVVLLPFWQARHGSCINTSSVA